MKLQTGLQYGKAYRLTANTMTRKGYTFVGWNTKADGTGKTYANKASVKNLSTKNKATVTLYAQWTEG
ncbi:MAG: InlB B-repeat-containing protein [Lachnospiraceae bacterium]|nr:InlB B-repeat-containing protein [Lachnospiraceae bacterium]